MKVILNGIHLEEKLKKNDGREMRKHKKEKYKKIGMRKQENS